MAMPETLHGGLSEIAGESPSNGSGRGGPSEVDAALARYLSQLGRMGEQLKQTSKQIEEATDGFAFLVKELGMKDTLPAGPAPR